MATLEELEAEIKLRGDKITAMDAELSDCKIKLDDATKSNIGLQTTLSNLATNLRNLQDINAALQAQVTTLSQRFARLLALHDRAGQLLSTFAKIAHDELNYRNGIATAHEDPVS